MVATYSEFKNEQSFQQLQLEASRIVCNVYRNGTNITQVALADIVKGDYVLLDSGCKVPADGVIISGRVLINQATLTGESADIIKQPAPQHYDGYYNKDVNDPHLVFRGSVVDEGEAVMLVKDVGETTIYGRLAAELSEKDDRPSPLKCKLSILADNISRLGYLGAVGIAISFLFKQFIMDNGWSLTNAWAYIVSSPVIAFKDAVTALILAIIIIVVAVPEGLPMMIAIVLSLNMRKLLSAKVLVRKLLGIETAGSISILFVDKTGTLTRGVFEPSLFIGGNLFKYQTLAQIPNELANILSIAIKESSSSDLNDSGQILGGNSSDRAMLSFVGGQKSIDLEEADVLDTILFNSTRKFSATHVKLVPSVLKRNPHLQVNKNNSIVFLKGAPEVLLPLCTSFYAENGALHPLTSTADLEREISGISSTGIRVILVATSKTFPETGNTLGNNYVVPPDELSLVGIIGISDSIRPSAAIACDMCRNGGIQVVMITGDKKETAVSVAQQIGLSDSMDSLHSHHEDMISVSMDMDHSLVLTSTEINSMSDSQIASILPNLRVLARALPTDKSRLVRIAQDNGHVVGMTGDGVNDSAALRLADVGFAMGSGAEVAKEAADIVIMDDNFSSITQAILYGRAIYRSIRKFIIFQSTVNLASTVIVFLGPFMGYDFPLSLIQLLWVNLVMDTLAAIAYGGEPALPQYMNSKPTPRNEPIIGTYMWTSIISNGLFISVLSIFFLTNDTIEAYFRPGDSAEDGTPFLTGFFCFFIFITNFNSFNVRTKSFNILTDITLNTNFVVVVALIFIVQVTFTYWGGSLLRTVGLNFSEWCLVTGMALWIIPFDMLRKKFIVPYVRAWLRRRKTGYQRP
eukprot:TRINITY_DN7342_c0_g1_i1.p1 TRINITY_DN7342_c0_g1~~TRINITY_DN7342_c0_g1_i1.p1  ORF type:complete len:948 (+),score=114.40 TRINITY_DN7342_c0_g1_i1:264-2846(+)